MGWWVRGHLQDQEPPKGRSIIKSQQSTAYRSSKLEPWSSLHNSQIAQKARDSSAQQPLLLIWPSGGRDLVYLVRFRDFLRLASCWLLREGLRELSSRIEYSNSERMAAQCQLAPYFWWAACGPWKRIPEWWSMSLGNISEFKNDYHASPVFMIVPYPCKLKVEQSQWATCSSFGRSGLIAWNSLLFVSVGSLWLKARMGWGLMECGLVARLGVSLEWLSTS